MVRRRMVAAKLNGCCPVQMDRLSMVNESRCARFCLWVCEGLCDDNGSGRFFVGRSVIPKEEPQRENRLPLWRWVRGETTARRRYESSRNCTLLGNVRILHKIVPIDHIHPRNKKNSPWCLLLLRCRRFHHHHHDMMPPIYRIPTTLQWGNNQSGDYLLCLQHHRMDWCHPFVTQ